MNKLSLLLAVAVTLCTPRISAESSPEATALHHALVDHVPVILCEEAIGRLRLRVRGPDGKESEITVISKLMVASHLKADGTEAPAVYEVEIQNSVLQGESITYSLYNLGIQGRDWPTEIEIIHGNAQIVTPSVGQPVATTLLAGRSQKIRAASRTSGAAASGNDVAFLTTKDAVCTLRVKASRQRHGEMLRTPGTPPRKSPLPFESHDSVPDAVMAGSAH